MFFKEPTEVSTYSIDWSDWLGDLTITTSVWSVPAGITKDDDDKTDNSTLITLSGGTWATIYELENTITASDGSVETRVILVSIQRSVAYCSPLEVRRRASSGPASGSSSATITALPPAELEALIEQASRMFDLECGVPEGYFNPVAIPIPTTKTIYGNGTNYLKLPPYISGSLDSSITLPDGYTTPTFTELNGHLVINSGGVLPPFSSFHNCLWSGWQSGVSITISAIWGFRETPADVKMAVIELVLNLWRETDPNNIRLINLDNQPLREKIPPRVLEVARKYRFRTGVAFV
jgi:hypothetical protein